MTTPVEELELHLRREIGRVVHGADAVIHGLLMACIARGHVLLQGAPGLGKTLIAKTLARCLGGSFQRVQGTADLMPSDIIGVHVYDPREQKFVFHRGPLFADVLLMDEVNRAGPKTQSALLEAMEERQVTVERERLALSDRFMVLATQNPHEFEGTYPLPESQLDRFMLRIDLGYPNAATEAAIVAQYGAGMGAPRIESFDIAAAEGGLVGRAREQAAAVHVAGSLVDYVLRIAAATRQNAAIALGISTRAVLALTWAARVEAAARGAEFAAPDDVKAVAPALIAHRLVLSPEAALEGQTAGAVVARVLEQVPVPR
jgi:MoxR-like ATPase